MVGIAVQDQKASILSSHWPWSQLPTAYDGDNKVADMFQVAAIPQSYLLNPQGEVLFHVAGVLQGKPLFELKQMVERHQRRI